MSDQHRTKPSDVATLRAVADSEAGVILEVEPDRTAAELLAEKWHASLYTGAEVLGIAPRRWLLPKWLPLDAVIAVYGPPGVGKSLFALSLGLELSRGGRWAGERLTPVTVLYVAAERPTDQRDRAEAWQAHHRTTVPATFVTFAPSPPPQLTNPEHVDALCELVARVKPRVVIVDTYARVTLGLEENSSAATGPVLEALDRLRVASAGGLVIVVHHTGKDTTRGLRGSTAMLGALDLTIELTKDGERTVKARVDKSNAGPEPSPEWYSLEPVELSPLRGEVEMRSVPVMIDTGRPVQGPTDAILQVIGDLGSATRAQVTEGLAEDYGLKVSRSTLTRHLTKLCEEGRLTRHGPATSPQQRYSLPDDDPDVPLL